MTNRQKALARVAEAQTEFWDALAELESILGIEIDGTSDLTGYTEPTDEDVETLISLVGSDVEEEEK